MSISFSSLASTAFDTARSTFKAMAVAAAPQAAAPAAEIAAGPAQAASAASAATPAAPAAPAVAQRARLDITESSDANPFTDDEHKPIKRRVGTLLDSYA